MRVAPAQCAPSPWPSPPRRGRGNWFPGLRAGSRESTKEHWDRYWAEEAERSWPVHAKLLERLCEAVGEVTGRRILEVGGGSGVDSAALARGGGLATVLDYSEAALAAARTTARREGMTIQLVGADAHRMPFHDESFDVVFHQGFLEHFREPMPILVEQRRVLKRGGVLLVDVPQKYSFYTLEKRRKIRAGTWFAGWETEYSLGELERLVTAAGFQVVMTFGRDLQPFLARMRSLSAAGTRRIGRPYLPRKVARLYDRVWSFLESRRTVYRFCLNVGVVACRPS